MKYINVLINVIVFVILSYLECFSQSFDTIYYLGIGCVFTYNYWYASKYSMNKIGIISLGLFSIMMGIIWGSNLDRVHMEPIASFFILFIVSLVAQFLSAFMVSQPKQVKS